MKSARQKWLGFAGLALWLGMSPGCLTRSLEAQFPYAIDFTSYQANWGAFAPGDDITITAVRSDRPHLEAGGRYLVMGIGTLSSANRAKLGLSVTVPRDSPGMFTLIDKSQNPDVEAGTHDFALMMTMEFPGAPHVTMRPDDGGAAGTIYFRETESHAKAGK
jgi:hypothetical protein